MLAFARALGDFGATMMVAGDIPGRTQTASLAIFDAVNATTSAPRRLAHALDLGRLGRRALGWSSGPLPARGAAR